MQRFRRILRAVILIGLLMSWCGITAHADGQAAFGLEPTAGDPDVSATGASFVLNRQLGTTMQKHVRVTNSGSAAGSVRFYSVDATTAKESGIVFRNESDPRTDVGAWISVSPGPVTLNANESQVISFTLAVPANARAGQHVGGIAAEAVPTEPPGGGDVGVGIRSVTIIPVQVNLPGVVVEQMTVTGITPSGDPQQELLLGLRNDGTVMLQPTGSLTVRNAQGQQVRQIPLTFDTFLPQTAIQYAIPLQAALSEGEYGTVTTLTYGASRQASQALFLEFFYVPTLTGVTPSSGGGTGGNTVTLTGGMFGTPANTQVFIDGVALPSTRVLSVTATRIAFTAPAHTAGAAVIMVKVSGAAVNGNAQYSYGEVGIFPIKPPSGGSVGPAPGTIPASRPSAPVQGSPGGLPMPRP